MFTNININYRSILLKKEDNSDIVIMLDCIESYESIEANKDNNHSKTIVITKSGKVHSVMETVDDINDIIYGKENK